MMPRMPLPETAFFHALWITALSSLALAGLLSLFPRLGAAGARFSELLCRAPLLDHRIIEFAFGRVPDGLKVTARARKILLRQLAQRVLPRDFDAERKQGFSMPLGSWFRGSWGNFFADVLSQAPRELFDPAEVHRLLDEQRRGRAHMHRLFALTMFELWRREYGVAT